jgi:hypothetical protein
MPLVLGASILIATAAQTPESSSPVHLTAEQDQQRLLNLLHIDSLRPGANGKDPKAPNAANYDESKATTYRSLPDPLLLKNGDRVTTPAMWWNTRRPEIVEDFDREVYGRMPAHTPKVNWEAVSVTQHLEGDVPVTTKKLLGHVDNSSYPAIKVDIDLTLTTPSKASGPVPVMMEFGYVWPKGMPRPPQDPGPSWQSQVLAKGWGYAVLLPTTVQADNGAGLTEGIIGLMNKGQPRRLDDWGALRAWAWGASRVLDYFETDRTVDAKHVGLEGHSRFGKATLATMAYDNRFAVGYVSSSGEGGAKIIRRTWGEVLENLAAPSEYHWMAGNFLKYAGPLTANNLPVDAHELIALCAPRPLFIGAGATAGDGWADARGMFLAEAGADPVYRLLGKKGLGTETFPPIETALISGDLGFRQHSGGHTPAPNWPTFLTFAQRYLEARPSIPPAGTSKQ